MLANKAGGGTEELTNRQTNKEEEEKKEDHTKKQSSGTEEEKDKEDMIIILLIIIFDRKRGKLNSVSHFPSVLFLPQFLQFDIKPDNQIRLPTLEAHYYSNKNVNCSNNNSEDEAEKTEEEN